MDSRERWDVVKLLIVDARLLFAAIIKNDDKFLYDSTGFWLFIFPNDNPFSFNYNINLFQI